MEIERKFLLRELPFDPGGFESSEIEQSYVSVDPVIRLRRRGGDYILTVKGAGRIEREEFELSLTRKQYERLRQKAEGRVIEKTRYLVPLSDGHTAELDVFHGELDGLIFVEVEFETREGAENFTPPDWFGEDVSENPNYSNARLSTC